MTLEQKKEKKAEIIANTNMFDVLQSHGVEVNRNVCKCMFHDDRHPSAKVYRDAVHCFVCGRQWNVFDVTMQLDSCDFNTAFDLLGGNEVPSWEAEVKRKKILREKKQREYERKMAELRLKRQYMVYSALRTLVSQYEPYTDEWCYFQGRRIYELYKLEECERAADG